MNTLKTVLAATVLASLPITAQADPATVWEVMELIDPTITCEELDHLKEVERLQAYGGNALVERFMRNKMVGETPFEARPSCNWLKKGHLFRRGIAKKSGESYFCMEIPNFGIGPNAKAHPCLWINATIYDAGDPSGKPKN
jgi:hypothetical protein